jgi:hypothetical protein
MGHIHNLHIVSPLGILRRLLIMKRRSGRRMRRRKARRNPAVLNRRERI